MNLHLLRRISTTVGSSTLTAASTPLGKLNNLLPPADGNDSGPVWPLGVPPEK
ncbi:MAG: hypothetical protein Faunusvirus48_6 [Faunusvirus sp.]|uniref:Uncharacterized protein n=1 Tax=Faunusvirus sp. TaxID=2487766 RepID=A0A3G5A0J1_9VIRU|nr:MAG: hypothetical protein Faunusvirus48_6 [Faunusvirus sp.]